jgi:hypothetical protein
VRFKADYGFVLGFRRSCGCHGRSSKVTVRSRAIAEAIDTHQF